MTPTTRGAGPPRARHRRPRAGTRRAPGSGSPSSAPAGTRARTRRCATGVGAWRPPRALHRQALATLAAAPLEHDAPRAGAHAGTEAVGAGALALLGLVGPLHRADEDTGARSAHGGAHAVDTRAQGRRGRKAPSLRT